MAKARLINEEPPPPEPVNLNVPQEPVVVLELDANEAEAVRLFLDRGPSTSLGERRRRAQTGAIHASSLSAASVRVYEALRGKGF